MSAVQWEPPALDELDEALARSSNRAAFRADVDAAVADLVSGLIVGSRVPRTPCREFVFTRLPYRIVYQELPAGLRIYALAHHHRRSGYWKSRLRRP